ncbi:MAG TPA: 30S ribosome-binding factor RbfA [Spongiibacteraceae bacterium]|nr:ribosome-binding factor A [Spongiibacteraceae bacterium]HCS26130.1 30S ribosome-binding factor RbfA [Spongiibacteraceae bacterium]
MKEFKRTDRVADFLKKELGSLIQLELRDPRLGMISVTDVAVSRDLAHARIFVTVMGKETAEEANEALKVLNKAAGFLRSRVAKSHNARTTPALKFMFDTSVRRGEYMSRLIDSAVADDVKHHSDDTPEQ